jgi:hypothetical protein
MTRALRAALLIIPFILSSSPPAARAYWIHDGVALCSETGNQTYSQIVSDGAGGAIVAWQDFRGGSWDIYAQRVSGTGHAAWAAQGVVVCSATGDQQYPQLAPDGAGGAIISWQDNRGGNWDIYAQRVSSSGAVQWTLDGVASCTATGNQQNPQIASDGAGGAIVAWWDYRGATYDIYAQRVSGAGAVQWTADGVALCTANGIQYLPQLVSDGSGGAIVTWLDHRGGTYDVYAQRVNGSGAVQWVANGVGLCTATMDQMYPKIASDGAGGAIVAWYDFRPIDDTDIYAQRVNASGVRQWTTNGVALCTVGGNQIFPVIVSDGAGGAIVAWQDGRGSSTDVYAQRVNTSGAVQWPANGLVLCTETGSQENPILVSDGVGGAIVSWQDSRGGSYDIYAQRANALGAVRWTANGVALCTATADQQWPGVTVDGSGGAITAWWDNRGGNYDIYAQSVDSEGRVASLSPIITSVGDVPGDQGGWVRITIARSKLDYALETAYPISTYNVWQRVDNQALLAKDARQIDDERGFPPGVWELIGSFDGMQQSSYVFRVRTLADSSASGIPYSVYVVSAHAMTPSVWFTSAPDSGYSVDNIPPQPPTGLAVERCSDPEGLALTWDAGAESDLAHYAVYRGTSEGFAPAPGNRVATPTEPEWFDGEWRWSSGSYYKIAAIDRHDNQSTFALIGPDDVAGGETPAAPEANYLEQNFPNPFNPATRIAFELSASGNVSLRIYDVSGALVRVLVNDRRNAGRYEELWDGLDSNGRAVSSGMYFYKLCAGAFESTRKMILVR